MLDNAIKNLNLNVIIIKSKIKESSIAKLEKLEYSSSLVNNKNDILNSFSILH